MKLNNHVFTEFPSSFLLLLNYAARLRSHNRTINQAVEQKGYAHGRSGAEQITFVRL
jgi:hypothetical protein